MDKPRIRGIVVGIFYRNVWAISLGSSPKFAHSRTILIKSISNPESRSTYSSATVPLFIGSKFDTIQADIEEMKNSMSLYFSKSSSKSYKRIPQRKNRDQTAS